MADPKTPAALAGAYCAKHRVSNEFSLRREMVRAFIAGHESRNEEVADLRSALEELANLMDDVRSGDYVHDSFTCQPARDVLAKWSAR